MKKKLVIAACFLFIISRLIFVNTAPIFFDSAGYIHAFSFPNIFAAVTAVHFPLHDGYIILFWPFYHVAKFLGANPVYAVIVGQILFGLLSVYLFYYIVTFLSDKKTALIASIIISLTPLFWISNVTILYEIAYIGLFLLSLFFLVFYIERKKEYFLHVSAVCFCLALFTHMMVILWLPLFFAIAFFKSKKNFIKILIVMIIYIMLLTQIRKYIVSTFASSTLVFSFASFNSGTFNSAGFDIKGLLVAMRNFFIPLMRGYTSLVMILSIVSLGVLLFKNKKLFVYGFLWVVPACIALQFWEAQLPGRYGILAGFGLAFLTASLIKNSSLATGFVIMYLLIVSLPAMNLLRHDIPYLKLAEYTATLPKDSLLIESHFSLRQVRDYYRGKLLAVNEPGIDNVMIRKNIDEYLQKKKDVFISSPALTDPYGLYAGPYLHALSLSYAKPPEMQHVLTDYTIIQHKVINADDAIVMYKIAAKKKHPYPEIKKLRDHYRRLDYYDPLLKLYWVGQQLVLSK